MIKLLRKLYLALILFFLYAPIFVLIVFSFNKSKSRANWTGFTFKWYIELFQDSNITKALTVTLTIALLSSIIATILGTAAAIGINNMKKHTKKVVMNITNIPVVNPDIVTGVSMMILFVFVSKRFIFMELGYVSLLLAHITFNIPYVILSVLPKLRQLDKNLYEAALDLGASPLYAFRKVILPEITPSILAGSMLAFTLSLDDFVISFFTTGSGVNNLSILIYSMARRGINPKINALSTLMFIVVLLLLYAINKMEKTDFEDLSNK